MSSASAARHLLLFLPLLLLEGCRLPGKPGPNFVPTRPDQATNFEVLYQRNCQACHGVNGEGSMAISLASPAYIAYAGSKHIAEIVANGIGGSLMPAFASNAGGSLTDQQVQILAERIVSTWGKPASLNGAPVPPYDSQVHGEAGAGEALYRSDCLGCHAPGPSSILDPTYLSLISNGGLRTWIVAGKPSQGMPDWRGYRGGALSDQQISDLVSFMTAHRTPAPGQPFPNAQGYVEQSSPGTAEAEHQQQLSIQAGPATGGPKQSNQPVPKATPTHPGSLKP